MRKTPFILVLAFIVSPVTYAAGGNGMTWAKQSHDSNFGIDRVGCQLPGSSPADCNAYVGDTSCKLSRPVLCLKTDNSPRPPYPFITSAFYDGWAKGHIATTMPIQGTALVTATTGDAFCNATFGNGWKMAEFHNGDGGWAFRAYGNVRDDQRFWVRISDQPANCWNP
jgi:hypothetical protein